MIAKQGKNDQGQGSRINQAQDRSSQSDDLVQSEICNKGTE